MCSININLNVLTLVHNKHFKHKTEEKGFAETFSMASFCVRLSVTWQRFVGCSEVRVIL